MAKQLQHELQKLDPTSIMIITPKEIIYQDKTQVMQAPLKLTDTQKIRQKLPLYIKDLQKPITSAGLQNMVEVFGHSWEDKNGAIDLKLDLEKDLKILAHMYDSNFEVLKQEAYRVYLEEASDFTIPD
ncbi:25687_t:CDS:2, partial [Dentiscutata erythropus]